jgi:hypothetical protein
MDLRCDPLLTTWELYLQQCGYYFVMPLLSVNITIRAAILNIMDKRKSRCTLDLYFEGLVSTVQQPISSSDMATIWCGGCKRLIQQLDINDHHVYALGLVMAIRKRWTTIDWLIKNSRRDINNHINELCDFLTVRNVDICITFLKRYTKYITQATWCKLFDQNNETVNEYIAQYHCINNIMRRIVINGKTSLFILSNWYDHNTFDEVIQYAAMVSADKDGANVLNIMKYLMEHYAESQYTCNKCLLQIRRWYTLTILRRTPTIVCDQFYDVATAKKILRGDRFGRDVCYINRAKFKYPEYPVACGH